MPLEKNGTLVLEKKDFHYLRNVLRLRVGDMISVSAQGVMNMTLCKIDDNAKKIVLQKCAESDNTACNSTAQNTSHEFRAKYYLFQFVPKPQKMELIVRQATECGVSCIVPILGDYTQGGTEKALQNSARYERIIREARQQSGSQVETKILEPRTLANALDFWQNEISVFKEYEKAAVVLYERNEEIVSFANVVYSDSTDNGVAKIKICAIVVGSEGGISPAEFKTLNDAGFKALHFNTNILRCETAALYGIATLQCAIEN